MTVFSSKDESSRDREIIDKIIKSSVPPETGEYYLFAKNSASIGSGTKGLSVSKSSSDVSCKPLSPKLNESSGSSFNDKSAIVGDQKLSMQNVSTNSNNSQAIKKNLSTVELFLSSIPDLSFMLS